MKNRLLSMLIVFLLVGTATAQKKKLSVEELYQGTYRTERINSFRSLNNGREYTLLNYEGDNSTIDKYEYKGMTKKGTILSSKTANVPNFSSYEFSEDESKILLGDNFDKIYRHSYLGDYWVYDLNSKGVVKVSDVKIQEPALSPDGSKVAYVYNNNLYVFDIASKTSKQVTTDGKKGTIINGITDWVYEEEFAFVRAFEWNSKGDRIAFIRFDETNVPHFSMDFYGNGLYPYQYEFKYPKAGEVNSTISLHLYHLNSEETNTIDLGDPYYIARIKWMNHPDYLSVQTLNRHQNELTLHSVNTKKNKVSVLLEEKDDAYVDVTDNLTFLEDDSFIWTSEKDGFNHIYLYNEDGELMNQVTKGEWEVTQYYGYDQANDRVFYQSSENGSINRDVYSISSSGTDKIRLSKKDGTNAAQFSENYFYFINTHSNTTTPYEYTLHLARDGMFMQELKNNKRLKSKLEAYEIAEKEFSTININGYDLNMYMIKPVDFDPNKKYPLLMYQYSGPGSQEVTDSWLDLRDYWHQQLVAEGYVVACVDGRGTGLKGRDFKKITQKELGKYEVEDQIEAARKLSELPYIDEDKTGIWGWSYGGFMSTNCLLKGNDVFEMAIAVAPVTSWRFYDTIYTERYMQTPQENPNGYDDNSPLNYAGLLKGDYLLVHGSGDDNVHVQNTMRMAEALIQANKQFEWAIYPDKNHGIYGGNTRLHLFQKMTDFAHKNLRDRPKKEKKELNPIKG